MGLTAVSKMSDNGLVTQARRLVKKTGNIFGDFRSPDKNVRRLATLHREIGKRLVA